MKKTRSKKSRDTVPLSKSPNCQCSVCLIFYIRDPSHKQVTNTGKGLGKVFQNNFTLHWQQVFLRNERVELFCSHGTAKMARFVMQFEAPNKFAQLQVTLKQCCGSGIRNRFFPDPGSRIPDPGSQTHNSKQCCGSMTFWCGSGSENLIP